MNDRRVVLDLHRWVEEERVVMEVRQLLPLVLSNRRIHTACPFLFQRALLDEIDRRKLA